MVHVTQKYIINKPIALLPAILLLSSRCLVQEQNGGGRWQVNHQLLLVLSVVGASGAFFGEQLDG